MTASPYSWLLLASIAVSIVVWSRIAKRDERLLLIYVAALVGAFLGAKIVYLLAEGWIDWHQPHRWLRLATGKTIIGGLLGGYVSVELAKKFVGYQSATAIQLARAVQATVASNRLALFASAQSQKS